MFRKNKISFIIAVCLLLLISLTVGYGFLRRNLGFNGKTSVKSTKWDVHFENVKIKKSTAVVNSPATIGEDKTTLSFDVSLNKPGDTYEFYVDVVNGGTINAMVGLVPTIDIPSRYAKYIDYKITYADGLPLNYRDKLDAAKSEEDLENKVNVEQIRVVLKYIASTTDSQLPSSDMPTIKVELEMPYVQASGANDIERNNLYQLLAENAVSDSESSEFVTNESGILYNIKSSDTNGKGLYQLRGTEDDENPVYFYRGNVDNNNVIFANSCWKIVRTTETGGIKLLYNGSVSGGVCNNTGEDTALPGQTPFMKESPTDLTHNMYVYGNRVSSFNYSLFRLNASKVLTFGNNVKYEDGVYKLIDTYSAFAGDFKDDTTTNIVKNGYHYSCLSDAVECDKVYYFYSIGFMSFDGVILEKGATKERIFDEINGFSSRYDSDIKIKIDDWYRTYMVDYEDNLEDTPWCIDRRFSSGLHGWDKDGVADGGTEYAIWDRIGNSGTASPDLTCAARDSYTVSTANGNGKFTYPVGLLTLDEVVLAGWGKVKATDFGPTYSSPDYYIASGVEYWIISPPQFNITSSSRYVFYTGGSSHTSSNFTGSYARPVISLANDTLISSGDGSISSPYIIVEK